MSKNTQANVVRKPTNARTIMYINLLTRKNGVSPAEMKAAVLALPDRRAPGYTAHNSHSLELLAQTYGYRFFCVVHEDETRYYFESPKNAEFLKPYFAEYARKVKAAERAEAEQREAALAIKAERKLARETKAAKPARARKAKPAPIADAPEAEASIH